MKNYWLFLLLIMLTGISIGQDNETIVSYGKDESISERTDRIIKEREVFISKYVDSLNAFKNNAECSLPYFFTCKNFDQKHGSYYWITMHSPISMRKLIIDKIENYDLLWCVENSNDPRVTSKDTSKVRCLYCKIPFDQFSNKDLVTIRLEQLLHEKSLNSKTKN